MRVVLLEIEEIRQKVVVILCLSGFSVVCCTSGIRIWLTLSVLCRKKVGQAVGCLDKLRDG